MLAAVGDLVVAFGDRRCDASFAQPGPARFRRVALVGEHSLRPRPRSAGASGDADLGERVDQHARVRRLPGRQHERQRPGSPIADQVVLGRQPTAGAADRVVRRLGAELLVVRPSPLCRASGSRRAGARARWSSRSKRPSPVRLVDARATASSRAPVPRRPVRTTG